MTDQESHDAMQRMRDAQTREDMADDRDAEIAEDRVEKPNLCETCVIEQRDGCGGADESISECAMHEVSAPNKTEGGEA